MDIFMVKRAVLLGVWLCVVASSKIALAQCEVAISYAYPVGSEVQLNAHSTHLGPPHQMIATVTYTDRNGSSQSLRVNPRIEADFNAYDARLPQGASNIALHVDTGVGYGTSCDSPSVNVPFYQPAFWYSQIMPYSGGCELNIATVGSPGIYVPWYYGGSLAWWYNYGVADFHGVPIYWWSRQFPGSSCGTFSGVPFFKIMGDGLSKHPYGARQSAQNG